ncbi:MAG: alpha-L-fucosidase [Firmicutes bacterium]|nr:alpha-L-fucosidase [Bacillota bacterium]
MCTSGYIPPWSAAGGGNIFTGLLMPGYERLTEKFNPDKDWAEPLVLAAKGAGAKYITLTTRHRFLFQHT